MNVEHKPREYFYMLSALRGVAAILIVLRHTTQIFMPIRFPMSYMAVDLFFLLSGVVLEGSYGKRIGLSLSPFHFIWIRLVRIYPLYILGTLITVFTIIVSPGHLLFNGTSIYTIPHKILSLLFSIFLLPNLTPQDPAEFPFDHPAWSLFFELSVNIFYGFIAMRLSTQRAIVLTTASGIGLLASLLYFHHRNIVEMGWMRFTIIGGVFRTGFSFFLGVLIYRFRVSYPIQIGQRLRDFLPWVAVVGTMCLLMAPLPKPMREVFYIISVFALFPLIVYVALIANPSQFMTRIWTFLGDISYAVYTLHVPTYFFICSIILPFFGISAANIAPWFGIIFLVTLMILAFFVDRIYDRPSQKTLRSWWKSTPRAAGGKHLARGKNNI